MFTAKRSGSCSMLCGFHKLNPALFFSFSMKSFFILFAIMEITFSLYFLYVGLYAHNQGWWFHPTEPSVKAQDSKQACVSPENAYIVQHV